MRKCLKMFIVASLCLVGSSGCASNTKTVKTETDFYRPGEPTVVKKETTVTEKPAVGSNGGVLSGTVNAVGEVVALPFRAVGGLIRAIF